MRRVGCAVGAVGKRNHLSTISDVEMIDRAIEQRQCRYGLVEWHLVSGLVDASEAEVAVLFGLTVLDAVDHEGNVTRGVELRFGSVVHLLDEGRRTEPVDNVVCVAVVDVYDDTAVDDAAEIC